MGTAQKRGRVDQPRIHPESMTTLKRKKQKKQEKEFSKRLIADTRRLLWIVTIGGLALAAWCIKEGFDASLPWLTAMVGLPWTAHGTVCSFYLNMAKSDHREGGITFEAAKAAGFEAAGTETGNGEAVG